jgi:hypothetical protein
MLATVCGRAGWLRSQSIRRDSRPARLRHRTRQKLRLPALAVRRHHQPLRHLIADLGAIVAPHQMQQHVQPGSRTGRRNQLAVIHIQIIGLHLYLRIAPRQLGRIAPVGGGGLAIEHPAAASTNTPEQIEHRRAPR